MKITDISVSVTLWQSGEVLFPNKHVHEAAYCFCAWLRNE